MTHRADGSGGSTSERILACECRRHHLVRHLPGWRVCLNQDKTMTWHTPLGKVYTTKPNGFFPKRR